MFDVVVLGGGLIGCASARLLARSGLRVAVIERRRCGSEASGAAAGMLGVQSESDDALMLELSRASSRLYPPLLEALREETGLAVEFWREGTVQAALTAADEAELAARRDWLLAAGTPVEWLSARQLRTLEPVLNPRVRGGLLLPLDARLDNVALTAALARAAVAAGCVLREEEEVRSVVVERGAVAGVVTSAGRIACGAVVNAMGAWAARVRGMTPLPIEPVRGQIAVLQAGRPPCRHALASCRGYAAARRDGRVLLGSTQERAGFRKRVTAGGLAGILAHALELAPAFGRLPLVASWAGLRPGSADGRPIIGPDPAVRGYLVATGHFRNGVLLAPLTAELVAGALRGERSPWADALAVDRRTPATSAAALTL